jgi:hypothetical protein
MPFQTDSAVLTTPTFRPTSNDILTWPNDTFQPANPSPTSLRPDRPRLIAPSYKWQLLPQLISKDPYLKGWNDTIFGNATQYYNEPPVKYFMDGSSGILDNARDVKRRIKAFGYAYRMTNDTRWVDRTWTELKVGSRFITILLLLMSSLRMRLTMDRILGVLNPMTSGIKTTSWIPQSFLQLLVSPMIFSMTCGPMTRRA